MKTKNQSRAEVTEEDIRAYAAHLYEQSGRVAGRDLDNWLEAEQCLRACAANPSALAGYRRHVSKHGTPRGFTMPPSDVSLSMEKLECSSRKPRE